MLFNSLPANIRGLTQCTVNTFKHKLDEYLKNIQTHQKYRDIQYKRTQTPQHLCGVPGKAEQYSYGGVTDLAREITLKL